MRARRLAALLYALVGLALLALGGRYTLASELMPYHLAVIHTPWADLEPGQRTLSLGLLRGFGAGAACAGATLLLLALRGWRGGAGAGWRLLAGLSLAYTGLLAWVTRGALLPGARPIAISTGLCVLAAAAALASWLGRAPQVGDESL